MATETHGTAAGPRQQRDSDSLLGHILTPFGRFGSAKAAAKFGRLPLRIVNRRLAERAEGWRYVDEATSPPPAPERRGKPKDRRRRCPVVAQAHRDMHKHRIPVAAYRAYCLQYHAAMQRGIAWDFDLPCWWDWWCWEDRWSRRGQGSDDLCMARFGDHGPYAPWNVYATTNRGNLRDRPEELRRRGAEARGRQLSQGEAKPPRSRPVIAPDGTRYGSAALAAEAAGLNRHTLAGWARHRRDGWRYADMPPVKPRKSRVLHRDEHGRILLPREVRARQAGIPAA